MLLALRSYISPTAQAALYLIGADAVILQIRVGRQIFAEIRHQPLQPKRDHVLLMTSLDQS